MCPYIIYGMCVCVCVCVWIYLCVMRLMYIRECVRDEVFMWGCASRSLYMCVFAYELMVLCARI